MSRMTESVSEEKGIHIPAEFCLANCSRVFETPLEIRAKNDLIIPSVLSSVYNCLIACMSDSCVEFSLVLLEILKIKDSRVLLKLQSFCEEFAFVVSSEGLFICCSVFIVEKAIFLKQKTSDARTLLRERKSFYSGYPTFACVQRPRGLNWASQNAPVGWFFCYRSKFDHFLWWMRCNSGFVLF